MFLSAAARYVEKTCAGSVAVTSTLALGCLVMVAFSYILSPFSVVFVVVVAVFFDFIRKLLLNTIKVFLDIVYVCTRT